MLEVNSNSLERKSRIQSALVTLVIQLLLFLAFYFMVVWEQPNPPIPTYGLELNLGFSDFGSGDPSEVLPNSSEIPVTEAPAPGEIVPPTQTAVATEEENPVIQVWTPESVVPVLPANGVPSGVDDAPPVPP